MSRWRLTIDIVPELPEPVRDDVIWDIEEYFSEEASLDIVMSVEAIES